MYKRFGKRLFDVISVLVAFFFFWWLFLFVALLVRVKLGSPVIFKQKRPGKEEKIFVIYKFRTMTDERDEKGNLLSDNKRLTRFGRFLRSTSLDELPELINVLKGEMSLVGPRPLLMQYLPLYTKEQRRRHEVHPGITGYAQVEGRNSIDWEEKFKWDIEYINNLSFFLDLKIIVMTFAVVFMQRGINNTEEEPMPDFLGTKDAS